MRIDDAWVMKSEFGSSSSSIKKTIKKKKKVAVEIPRFIVAMSVIYIVKSILDIEEINGVDFST